MLAFNSVIAQKLKRIVIPKKWVPMPQTLLWLGVTLFSNSIFRYIYYVYLPLRAGMKCTVNTVATKSNSQYCDLLNINSHSLTDCLSITKQGFCFFADIISFSLLIVLVPIHWNQTLFESKVFPIFSVDNHWKYRFMETV